jgi:hypothetical protein
MQNPIREPPAHPRAARPIREPPAHPRAAHNAKNARYPTILSSKLFYREDFITYTMNYLRQE